MFLNVFVALFQTTRLTRHEFIDDHVFPQVYDKLLRYLPAVSVAAKTTPSPFTTSRHI